MGMNFTRYFNAPTLLIIHTGHEKRATTENGSKAKEIFIRRDLRLRHNS